MSDDKAIVTSGEAIEQTERPAPPAKAAPRKVAVVAPSEDEGDAFAAFARGDMTAERAADARLEARFDAFTEMGSQMFDILGEEAAKAKTERPREAGARQVEHDIKRAGSILWRFFTE